MFKVEKIHRMKRFVVIVLTVLFGLAIFSSCKTADCPAYSKVNENNIEQPA